MSYKLSLFFWVIIIFIFSHPSFAQEKAWSLDECIEYATANNLALQTTDLNFAQSEVKRKQASLNNLPSLNGGGTHGYNWGQSIDPFTNQFATSQVRTNNLYLSSNWVLFNGLQDYHLVQRAKTEKMVQTYNREVQQRNLKIDVTAHYLQILLNQRKLKIAQEQMSYTRSIFLRTKELVAAEQLAAHELAIQESQIALDTLAVIKAENELQLALLKLKQFLNFPQDQTISIADNDAELTGHKLTPVSVDSSDIQNAPEVLQAQQQELVNETNLQIAKGRLSPTLTVSASLGSGYSGNNVELIGSDLVPKPFNRQLDENFYQSATLTLTIPLFNKGSVSADIASNKIEVEKARIQREQVILELRNKIEQLNIEIENASMQEKSANVARQTTNQLLKIAKLRYEEGAINFTEFLEIRKKHFEAETLFTNASYEHFFKVMILGYYVE